MPSYASFCECGKPYMYDLEKGRPQPCPCGRPNPYLVRERKGDADEVENPEGSGD